MAAILPFLKLAGSGLASFGTTFGPMLSCGTTMFQASAAAGEKRQQAYDAKLKGRADAVAYTRESTEKLRELRISIAANLARGAAGNLDPFAAGETFAMLNINNLKQGASDFYMAKDNAELSVLIGNRQAEQYNDAAATTMQYGFLTAATDATKSAVKMSKIGKAPTNSGTG